MDGYLRKPAVQYLYPAVLCYSSILFATYPARGTLVLDLVRYRLCGQEEQFNDDDGINCDEDKVSKQGAILLTYIGLASALPPILVAGPLGAAANKFGRKYPAALVCCGEFILCIIMAIIAHFKLRPEWMVIATFIEGITGAYPALLMCTSSYVADLNTLQSATLSATDKVERYSFVEAALSIGILIGPFGGGVVIDFFGYTKFFLGCAIMLIGIILYFLYIPDSLPPKLIKPRDRSLSLDVAADALKDNAFQVLKLAFVKRPLLETAYRRIRRKLRANRGGGGRRSEGAGSQRGSLNRPLICDDVGYMSSRNSEDVKDIFIRSGGAEEEEIVPAVRLNFVSVAFMLLFGNNNSSATVIILYTARKYGWGPLTIGVYISCIGGVGTFALLVVRRAYKWVIASDLKDFSFMIAGAVASVCFNLLFGLLSSPTVAFALLPLTAFTLGALPSYRSVYSSCYGVEDKSRVFAAVSMLESVPNILAPLVYNQIYAFTVSTSFPEAVFMAIAASGVIAGILLWNAESTMLFSCSEQECFSPAARGGIGGGDGGGGGEGGYQYSSDVSTDVPVHMPSAIASQSAYVSQERNGGRPRLLSDSALPSAVSTTPKLSQARKTRNPLNEDVVIAI